jgi:hypothetical protein
VHDGPPLQDGTTTVDGHPARVLDESSGLSALVVDVEGMPVLALYDDAVAALFPDGLGGLFRQLEIYPDPANWR